MALNHFTYNGQSTGDYGLLVSAISAFGAPARKVETLSVPGRNGNIQLELGGYENYIVRYDISIIDKFKANARDIANWLLSAKGYMKLTDTYDPDTYRMAAYYNQMDYVASMLYRYGQASVEFDCKPQRFLILGDEAVEITSGEAITNPTLMEAEPIIRVYGKGNIQIGDQSIEVLNNTDYVDINSQTLQCYEGETNRNNDVQILEFPTLKAGETTITFDNTITKVEVTPKWWKL